MSAKLCSSVDENFSNAVNFEKFFTKINITRIRDNFDARENPKIGCGADGCKTNLFFGFFFDGSGITIFSQKRKKPTPMWPGCMIVIQG